jgi:hypothetical protein
MAAEKVLTLLAVEFELRERGTIAGMLFKPIQDDNTRIRFVRTLARLCYKQETRKLQAFKRKRVGLVSCEPIDLSFSKKTKKGNDSVERSPLNQDCKMVNENVLEARSRQLFPTVASYLICLICIGNEEFSDERRMRCILRKDVLRKHVETHF